MLRAAAPRPLEAAGAKGHSTDSMGEGADVSPAMEPASGQPSDDEQPLAWVPDCVAQVRVEGAEGVLLPWQLAVLGVHADAGGAWVIDAGVARARERAEVAVEFEHIATAFARGDGRRVAQGISSLVRFALSLGDEPTAERAHALRLGFLRTGTVDRGELNRLRVALWTGVSG